MSICTVTGHRKFNNLSWEEVAQAIRTMTKMAESMGATRFYSGAALGTDLIAGMVWNELGVEWVAVKPCANHGVGLWTPEQIEFRDRILEGADKVVELRERYVRGCLNRRNEAMLKYSDIVIGVFDGRKGGGTKHCLSLARRQNKQIIWFDARDKQIKRVN